ncbi:speckle targeted PIP5K1A-regulated poly(A) polymerase [Anabrus simplex]|uniref:speckle targeted PIP5K1A-regulated poly(A) polymerase n=1 Tax=Anabrus simplex TaxID=316456 RepID=UPI0035A2FFF0
MSAKFNCAVCGIFACDQKAWEQHITGRKHQTNLNKVHAAQEHFRKRQAAQAAEEKQNQGWLCTTCSVQLPDKVQFDSHMKGKRHIANAEKVQEKVECGVFVTGFPVDVRSEDLRYYFSNFGKLVEFIHIPGKNFLLLQYKDRQAARNVLGTSMYMYGRRLVARPRRPQAIPPPRRDLPPPPSIDVDHKEVKNILASGAGLEALMKELELPPGSEKKFEELCRDLEAAFRPSFPQCSACPFGSTVTGLALKGSDLDVFLNIASSADTEEKSSGPLPPEELVVIGRKVLRKYRYKFSHIIAVTKAKIPIIKFVHCPTKISCDVSFKNSLGVCNSQLIRFFISLDPRIRPYLMIIKYWARIHELASAGKMSNYALVMMSFFYLQQLKKPIIPSVAELQNSYTDSDLVDGWLCKFNKDRSCIKPTENRDSIFELLCGFFHYYAEFDYGGSVICPLIGRTIPKSSFLQPSTLPNELQLYKSKADSVKFKYSSDICIQDPFDLSHNLTGRLGTKSLTAFCAYCQSAAGIMNSLLQESEDSKRTPVLIELFDVSKKPVSQKFLLSTSTMVINVSVAQYLSLGYTLNGGSDNGETSDDSILRKEKLSKWYSLVYDLLMTIFQKIMKFSVKEESEESLSKVQKVGEPSDVHIKSSDTSGETGFSTRTIYCECLYNVWDGRKKIKKTLKLEPDLYVLTVEETISNVLVETRYSDGKIPPPILKFSCTFKPMLSPVQVQLTFQSIESKDKSFLHAMNLLQIRIPNWMDKSMAYLMKEHLVKSNSTKPSSDVNVAVVTDTS